MHGLMLFLLLGAGATASLGSCTRAPGPAAAEALASQERMAVQLYSFHKDLERDLPGTLRRIKMLGFDRVETYPIRNVSAAQLRAALNAAGLEVVSAHMPWDRIKTDIAGVIADVRTLGAEQFGPGSINLFDGRPFRVMTLAEAEEAGIYLAHACAAARSADLRVFIHTHGNEFARVGETTPLDHMLRRAGSCFDIEADIAWVRWAGVEPAAFIRRYGAKVSALHIKDITANALTKEMGRIEPENFTVLGQGSMNWAAVLAAARAAGVRHYIIEDESPNPARQIPESLEFLSRIRAGRD